jgi:hypothetical protein
VNDQKFAGLLKERIQAAYDHHIHIQKQGCAFEAVQIGDK